MKIYSHPSPASEKRVASIINRGMDVKQTELRAVGRILEDVRENRDAALIEYVNRFDSPRLKVSGLKVSPEEFKAAQARVDRSFVRTLNRAVSHIEDFHRKQVRQSWVSTERSGTLLGQLIHPVDRAGVYVPGGTGGTTPLISSVLMGVIPAGIAGVERVFMATPPMKNGRINPYLLATAKKVGVDSVYKIGSAWAIAAFAYGTESIPKVDVIVGPGNIHVTLAKKIIAGAVGIDMIAGPSEILVIADNEANPDYIAADLLSQAEHDALASAILVTDSREMAVSVDRAIGKQIGHLTRKAIAKASLSRFGGIIVVAGIADAIALSNRIAPEHLELQIKDPFGAIGQIRNAGAVFLGNYTPEPVGDYIAGPNHVLPTAGTARFASALSVDHFTKKSSLIHYSEAALKREAADVIRLAELEGLDAHANAVKIRLGQKST